MGVSMPLLSRSFIRSLLVSLGTTASIATAALVAASGTASADPLNVGGWTSGIALGAPLPEGAYFVNIAFFIDRSAKAPGAPKIDAVVNVPVVAWSTPYTILGGRLEVLLTTPEAVVGINPGAAVGSSWHKDIYNTAALAGLAWDLGGGWGIANYPGFWAPVNTDIGNNLGLGGNFWTFVDIASIAYNHDKWSLSANVLYHHSGNDLATGIHLQPDTVDVDFAITKHIDKWEVGLAGYASTDLNGAARNLFGAAKQSQIALGGLVGYDFGPVSAQVYLTRAVAETNYTGYDTRLFARVTVPLWHPEAPAPQKALVTKY
jgi:hypothetical protein